MVIILPSLHHTVAARVLADLGHGHEDLIVAGLADLSQHLGGLLAGEDHEDHVHLLLGAVTLENGVAAVILLEVGGDLGGALVGGDQLQVGGTQGDLALQGGAQEQACGVACAVEDQEQEVIAQGADEGGDDQTPDGAFDKAQTRGLEALALDHHTGLEGLDGDLHDLGGADQEADENGGYGAEGFEEFGHGGVSFT